MKVPCQQPKILVISTLENTSKKIFGEDVKKIVKKPPQQCCLEPKEVHIYMLPEAAAPQTTPHTNGGQVTGFVS